MAKNINTTTTDADSTNTNIENAVSGIGSETISMHYTTFHLVPDSTPDVDMESGQLRARDAKRVQNFRNNNRNLFPSVGMAYVSINRRNGIVRVSTDLLQYFQQNAGKRGARTASTQSGKLFNECYQRIFALNPSAPPKDEVHQVSLSLPVAVVEFFTGQKCEGSRVDMRNLNDALRLPLATAILLMVEETEETQAPIATVETSPKTTKTPKKPSKTKKAKA